MKNWITILLIATFFAGSLIAQQNTETLFNRARLIGAFGAPIVEYNFAGEDVEVSVGGGGALIVDHFFFGGYGVGTADYSIFQNDDQVNIDLAHGGFWIGGTYQPRKLLHLYSSVKLGWGAIGLRIDEDEVDYLDRVFVVQPELGLELNVFRFLKIATTAGYRWVDGIDEGLAVTPDQFDGFSVNLTFRFGGFGHWRSWRN